MNKKLCTMIFGAIIAISSLAFAEDNTIINLLKNSELKIADNGRLPSWTTWVKCKFNQDAGYKGKNSVRMTLEPGDDITARCRIVLSQHVDNLKPGEYIFSAYVKLDRKIQTLSMLEIITLNGKQDYKGKEFFVEPGEWTKITAKYNIPDGVNSAGFAISFLDKASSGATVWVDSPVLYYKEKQ